MARTIVWGYPGYPGAAPQDCLSWLDNSLREGTRVVADAHGDGIALAFNEFVPDEHTVALYHMNEAAWTRQAGEVFDAGSYGLHATAYDGADTIQEGWLDRSGYYSTGPARWVSPASSQLVMPGEAFLAVWARFDEQASPFGARPAALAVYDDAKHCLLLGMRWDTRQYCFGYYDGGSWTTVSASEVEIGEWHHLAGWYREGRARLYVDGACVADVSDWPTALAWNAQAMASSGAAMPAVWQRMIGAADDALIAATNPWGGEFFPHRFEPGSVVALCELSDPQKLTVIDWSGTFGDDYGRVKRIYVRQPGGWQPVGDEYPSPPLTGLQYTVSGPELVKVELEPRQDSLHSDTPILDWLSVILEPVSVPRPPFRAAGISVRRLTAGNVTARKLTAGDVRARTLTAECEDQ